MNGRAPLDRQPSGEALRPRIQVLDDVQQLQRVHSLGLAPIHQRLDLPVVDAGHHHHVHLHGDTRGHAGTHRVLHGREIIYTADLPVQHRVKGVEADVELRDPRDPQPSGSRTDPWMPRDHLHLIEPGRPQSGHRHLQRPV